MPARPEEKRPLYYPTSLEDVSEEKSRLGVVQNTVIDWTRWQDKQNPVDLLSQDSIDRIRVTWAHLAGIVNTLTQELQI